MDDEDSYELDPTELVGWTIKPELDVGDVAVLLALLDCEIEAKVGKEDDSQGIAIILGRIRKSVYNALPEELQPAVPES